MIPALCYTLFLLAFVVDLLTPQLFVVAILQNGPIALSAIALRPALTVRLTVLAELANVIAGYINGLQAGHHWDGIAVGDRVLLGLSFLLVGALSMRAGETARRAGELAERERQVRGERALRHAMESVRASLNRELVVRRAAAEALALTGPDRVTIIVRESPLQLPESYTLRAGDEDVTITRDALSPVLASIVEMARGSKQVAFIDRNTTLGRMIDAAVLVAVLPEDTNVHAIILTWEAGEPSDEQIQAMQAFVDNLAVALQQTHLFIQLADRNRQIALQRNELEARGEVIRDIVYALAHDLRTPLAAADVTMTQALAGAYGTLPERFREILETSLASNLDLRRLVDTLLLVARYESGEDSRSFARHSLSELSERVLADLRPLAQAKGIALELHVSDDLWILADGDEIRRAIANLVANAIEATPAGGSIEVRAQPDAAMNVLSVLDDGYGVPVERRAALFQRFGGVRAGAGTGLGLYIVRRIAEKYAGRAGYEPREPSGSRFFIELPRTAANL